MKKVNKFFELIFKATMIASPIRKRAWFFALIVVFILAGGFYNVSQSATAGNRLEVTFQSESTPFYLPYIISSVPDTTPIGTATSTVTSTAIPTATSTATSIPTNTATPSPTIPCDYDTNLLPHHLQFENFTCGGEGIAYHDSDPSNVGGEYRLTEGVDMGVAITQGWGDSYFVGWTETGEWLEYDVYISEPGPYYFLFFVSSLSDSGRFHLEIDGVDVTGSLSVPNTGDEQTWEIVHTPEGTYLEAGYYTFKLVIEAGGGNFDFLRTYPATPTPSP